MRVTVLYFAALRDVVGKDHELLELPPHVRTVADIAAFLAVHRGALAGRMRNVRIARNEEFARDDEPVADGDTIALLPPVSGG